MKDKLEFHIKHKKIQHLLGLPRVGQRSLNAVIPAPKTDHTRIYPKLKYDIEVKTSNFPFLIDEQKESLEGNVKKKKAHKHFEIILSQNRQQNRLGVVNLYSDSLEMKTADENPFHQEVRRRVESLLKKKVIKKQLADGELALTWTKDFTGEASLCQQSNRMNKGNEMNYTTETDSQPLLAGQQLQGEMGQKTITSLEQHTEENHLSIKTSVSDNSSTVKRVCSNVPVVTETATQLVLEDGTAEPSNKFETTLASKCLEIRLSNPQRSAMPGVKHVLFMEKASSKPLEMNLKQKRLASALGVPTIFSKSLEMIPPEETCQAKDVKSLDSERGLKCFKTLSISKNMKDKLEVHIEHKNIQHLVSASVGTTTNTTMSTLTPCIKPS
ncbi:uncharacterized protein LOC109616419 [Esox lucius]|uniref:uncharacterized protein LOC109616419 n=1 Tax=Esox lucius TaxID=8010 RepID=UPI001476BEF7|nr:uncharacterized protein LOC109616419 [Esox lucius]